MRIAPQIITTLGVAAVAATAAAGIASAAPFPTSDSGSTYIRTESGRTTCMLNAEAVNCTVAFATPMKSKAGDPANAVSLNESGAITYVAGDFGAISPVSTIKYGEKATINGWYVEAFPNGTRFTSNRTDKAYWVDPVSARAV